MSDEEMKKPPELVELKVVRCTYCDQQTADRIIRDLWEKMADVIAELAEEEKWEFPDCRNGGFRKRSYVIEEYLRNEEAEVLGAVNLDMAIIDIISEVSRRLRTSLGLKEIPVVRGKPLADGPNGKLVELMSMEVAGHYDYRSEKPMTKEMADKVLGQVYEQAPVLMFVFAEQFRHLITLYDVENRVQALIDKAKEENDAAEDYGFRLTLMDRLWVMCEMPSVEEMVEEMDR